MSKADKMFKELGYVKVEENDMVLHFENDIEHKNIIFYKRIREYECFVYDTLDVFMVEITLSNSRKNERVRVDRMKTHKEKQFEYLILFVDDYSQLLNNDEKLIVYEFVINISKYLLDYSSCDNKECVCNSRHSIKQLLKNDLIKGYIMFADEFYGKDYMSELKELGWLE